MPQALVDREIRRSGLTDLQIVAIELAPLARGAVWPLASGRSEMASR
jgi:hypothetical protein